MDRTFIALCTCAAFSAGASAQTFNFGMYEGQWDNTTFGSSGAASLLIEDLGGGDVQMTADLDGFVFGIGDPDAVVVLGTLMGDIFSMTPISSPTFGDVTGGVDEMGNLSFDLVDAAMGDFSLVTLRGTAIGDSIQADYEIFTQAGTAPFAVGEINLRYVPAPGAAMMLGLGGLAASRRRR